MGIRPWSSSLHLTFLILIMTMEVECEANIKQSITIAVNNTAEFYCPIEDVKTTIWNFQSNEQGISITTIGQEHIYKKFEDRYALERRNTTSMILRVLRGLEEDEGTYKCEEQGKTKAEGILTVEIPPKLHLKVNDSKVDGTTIDVEFKKEHSIQCVANGGKPSVSLSWKVNGQVESVGVTTNMSLEAVRVITSTLKYIPILEDETVTCLTGGQSVIPSKDVNASVNVMYEPVCSVVVSNETSNMFRIICSCNANPEVNNVSIYVNDTLFSDEEDTTLPSTYQATVYCFGSNAIGSVYTKKIELQPFYVQPILPPSHASLIVPLCVIIPILLIVAIGAIIWWRKANKAAKEAKQATKDANQATEDANQATEDATTKTTNVMKVYQTDANIKSLSAAANPLPVDTSSNDEQLLTEATPMITVRQV